MNTTDLTQHSTIEATASHRALHAITGHLSAWAKADATATTQQEQDAADALQEQSRAAYALQMRAHGGSTSHQGWGVDLDQAETWWMNQPKATDEAWADELNGWAWEQDEAWSHAQQHEEDKAFAAEQRDELAKREAIKAKRDTLSERMAMAWFFVGSSGDEDSNRLVLRWVRQDDHASIAWLILSDHVLSDDDEAMELVQSILAGGEAG